MGLNASKNNMLRAVKAGDLKGLKSFIGTYQDPPEFHINQADPTGRTILLEACNCGHIDIVRYLLGVKADTNISDFRAGETPLLAACKAGSLPILKLLLEHKANIETASDTGQGPLHYAAGFGNLSIVKYLVEEAKIDIKAVNRYGKTPLEVAVNGAVKDYLQAQTALSLFQAVKNESLLDAKALIPQLRPHFIEKQQDEHGNTLPHLACENGDLAMLQILLDAKASINACRKDGKTPLLIACCRGHVRVVKRLVELKADMKAADSNGKTPLLIASERGHVQLARCLVELKADVKTADGNEISENQYLFITDKPSEGKQIQSGEGPLHYAAHYGNLPILKYLVEEAKIDIKAVDESGVGPLHCAAGSGDLSIVKYLVEEAKIDIKAVDESGHGPLHYAAGSGDLSIVKYLVEEAKIDIKAVDESGKTPLEVAVNGAVKDYLQAQSALSLFQAVKNESLRDAKALLPQLRPHFIEKEQDEHGNTLPHLACENCDLEMLQLLLDAKASINARRKDGKTPLLIACGRGHVQIVKRLVELKAEMKAGDTNEDGPLHCACYNGHLEVIKFMVDTHHFDFEAHNNQGYGPLHLACLNGHLNTTKFLVENKVDIEAVNEEGKTPLLIASDRGDVQLARCLVELKADVKTADCNGHGPLHLACLKRDLDMVKCLVESCKVNIEAVSKQGKTALSLAREVKQEDLVSYVEGAIVKDKKITESRLYTFDNGLVRTWLLATQTKSRIESSVIQMLYAEKVDGQNLLSLARDPKMKEVFPELKSVQWMNIRRFLKPIFESNAPKFPRPTFGRLMMFAREEVNLEDAKELGRGAYGRALLVKVVGLPGPVVLKRNYYPNVSLKSLDAIEKMDKHQNILHFIGMVTLDNEKCLISEYCAKGSLFHLSRKNDFEPSDEVLLSYANAIANGLMHLHSKEIVHRDLRADNILVHSDNRVVIGDYGLSRKLPPKGKYYKGVNDQPIPERWMAPECLRDKKYTFKGDIWSLGVTLFELMTCGRSPYADLDDWKRIRPGVINGSIRLIDKRFGDMFKGKSFPVPSKMIDIAKKCLDFDEKRRPDAGQVLGLVEVARGLRRKYDDDSYN